MRVWNDKVDNTASRRTNMRKYYDTETTGADKTQKDFCLALKRAVKE